MSYAIEPMKIKDFDEVTALWRGSEGVGLTESDNHENTAIYLKRNRGLSQVARLKSGKLVGAVLCGYDGRRGYLHHLAVAKNFRRRGIGAQLVTRCLEKLRRLGIQKCNIFVYADNTEGKAFWKHLGWKMRSDLRMMQVFTARKK
jgi:ribosomal protein S18 acetylase RimI-like enzyme